MVIANSDSDNTLVSLGGSMKRTHSSIEEADNGHVDCYEPTELLLPGKDGALYLPRNDHVDLHLQTIPELAESGNELLDNGVCHFTTKSEDRIIYVAQGEIAHATRTQCEVLASDRATTCHILALRSSASEKNSEPLASLTHIDSASYDECVRSMFKEHVEYHRKTTKQRVTMDVHIVGGFEDDENSSRAITNWLFKLLSKIAAEEKANLIVALKTCVVSSMNDTGYACPVGRGLGINIETGKVFLAKVDDNVAGPSLSLRSARLYSRQASLAVIHTARSDNKVSIEPFRFAPFQELELLLKLPDDVFLRCTSTSPDVEEPDFCESVRATLKFLRDVKCTSVFGKNMDRPAVFVRLGTSNSWKLESRC